MTALALLIALAGGSAALSGCGASATLDPIARAAEVSSQQEGAQISLSVQFSSAMLPGGSIGITANGYLDQHNRSGELTFDLSQIPGISALTEGSGGTMQLLIQYPTVYLHAPFLAGKLPEGKTWVEVDLSKLAQMDGGKLPQLSSLEQADPTQLLEYLRAKLGGVTTLGTESIDGVSTTHYRATLQVSSILEHVPAANRAAAEAGLEKLAGASDGIPVDVWIDGQNRVRRVQISLGSASAASGAPESVSGTITLDFTSYGPVPAVVPPPASEVFEASSLLDTGLAGASSSA